MSSGVATVTFISIIVVEMCFTHRLQVVELILLLNTDMLTSILALTLHTTSLFL